MDGPGSPSDWQRQDPRKIDLDRTVGWITTGVFSLAMLLGSGILWLIANRAIGLIVLVLWLPVTLALGLLAHSWPRLDYERTRYRIDDELIEIEGGVWWRSSVSVPRPRVQHLDVSQGPVQRHFGLGVLSIYTAGTEHSLVMIPGLSHETALQLRDRLLPRQSRVDGV